MVSVAFVFAHADEARAVERAEAMITHATAAPASVAREPLANASLAVQRTLGVAAEPLLLEPGAPALLAAAEDAALVVVGLTDRWRVEGLGHVRESLAAGRTPVVLVRRGLRPGGLAPHDARTRFTWTIKA